MNNKAYAKAEERFKLAIKEVRPYLPTRPSAAGPKLLRAGPRALSPETICRRRAPGEMGPLGPRGRHKASDDVLFSASTLAGLIQSASTIRRGRAAPEASARTSRKKTSARATSTASRRSTNSPGLPSNRPNMPTQSRSTSSAIAIHERKTPDENLDLAETAEQYAILLAKLNRLTMPTSGMHGH